MFELTTEPLRHWWPVKVKMPSGTIYEEAGHMVEREFKVLFEALPQEEGLALDAEARAAEIAGDTSKRNLLMLRVVHNWADVVDKAGKPVLFSKERLVAMLATSWTRIGLSRAWVAYLAADPALGN